ncbi:hypothetical protein FHS78_000651 [Parvibaculum indicum]|nr:hypothetical protein [Parvibaculum indicum]
MGGLQLRLAPIDVRAKLVPTDASYLFHSKNPRGGHNLPLAYRLRTYALTRAVIDGRRQPSGAANLFLCIFQSLLHAVLKANLSIESKHFFR